VRDMVATYWIIATGISEKEQSVLTTADLERLNRLCEPGFPCVPFKVPSEHHQLNFGSFDNLIRLSDELQKYDQQVEGVLRRLERQLLELEADFVFQVKSQREWMDFEKYIKEWQWDEGKFPKSRALTEIVTRLLNLVNKLDEECRSKAAQYNELKTLCGNLKVKDVAGNATKDLVDVLTPEVVKMNKPGTIDDDFIQTEYMTTVILIIGRSQESEFLSEYERMAENVVPGSARKFPALDDKDGNSIWRVVMFKSVVDDFKRACRDKKFTCRDFQYSKEEYDKLTEQRDKTMNQKDKLELVIKDLFKSSWSDVMIGFVHIKAVRVFVESTLRFGVPPHFTSTILAPLDKKTEQMRKELSNIVGAGDPDKAAMKDDDEEFFPYVSFAFTPFAPKVA